jgi:hypothetical protein
VTYGNVSIELALANGVKIKADRGDLRCQDFICAKFREFCAVTQRIQLEHVDYGQLFIEWVEEANWSEANAAPLPSCPEGEGDLFSM